MSKQTERNSGIESTWVKVANFLDDTLDIHLIPM